jgi:multisubunit Na+/H+ antiporter MnhC subunit
MELLMAIGIGTLFGTGLYLCLRRRTFQLILGLALLSHGTNLLILNMGRIRKGAPPIIQPGVTLYADSLVEALILTAIVIGFGVTAFLLVLSCRAYQESGTDSVNPIDPPEGGGPPP